MLAAEIALESVMKLFFNGTTSHKLRKHTDGCFNSLITNDTHMHQIIVHTYTLLTLICDKDEGTHFNDIFGCYERATALSGFVANSVVLWLSFGWYFISLECTRDAQSRTKFYQNLHKAAKLLSP